MLSSSQLLELVVVFCQIRSLCYAVSQVKSAFALAQSKSGSVRADTLPARPISILLSVLQTVLCFPIPVVYTFAVVGAGLTQPAWMTLFALPDEMLGVSLGVGPWKTAARASACVAHLLVERIASGAFKHLGDQYHPIGRREKLRIVQTGPYAHVRHPLYALAMLQPVVWSLAFWSYVPLFAVVGTAVVFVVKIHIEEEIIQRDASVREAYRAYMRKVPARVVPHVW